MKTTPQNSSVNEEALRRNLGPGVRYNNLQDSSKSRRGLRGKIDFGSPYPMLHRKFDFTHPAACSWQAEGSFAGGAKNSASTLALSNPDIGPQSRPIARAARIRYPPCSVPLRLAVTSVSSGLVANTFFIAA